MGCDSSKNLEKNDSSSEENDENKKGNKNKERNEESTGKEGNKENKDNKKNKKDQRRKRDMKNQKELNMSENDESISNSDSYKLKKKYTKKLKSSKKVDSESSEDEKENNNKEDNSNINTEGMATVESKKFNLKKNENEGLLIMDGIEDLFPEDLTEDDIYQLVEDALGESIVENEEDKIPGTITKLQAKSIAKILYKKLKKKKGKHDVDISEYPELKGVNVKIGAGQLTKDVIKNMMFNDNDIDEKQIDKAYRKLTKNASDVRALTIELITDDTDNK
jgi:hypothetical protein